MTSDRKYRWIGRILGHDGLEYEITEGRMRGKPIEGGRRRRRRRNLLCIGKQTIQIVM